MDDKLQNINVKSALFTTIKPFLLLIDNGNFYRKPVSLLYGLLGVVNLTIPLTMLFGGVAGGVFSMGGELIVGFILAWVVISFISWISFQIWWDRKSKVNLLTAEDDKFVATPIFAHFIQTSGECIGVWVGLGAPALTLVMLVSGGSSSGLMRSVGFDILSSNGLSSIVVMPVVGFFIIIGTKFFAEQCNALSMIANNTKK